VTHKNKPFISTNETPKIPFPRNSSPYIVRAALFIHRNFSDSHLTIKQVARHVGMEEDDFYNLFRKEVKITPMKFLAQVRVHKSKFYLQEPDLSIYKVASHSGFKNYDSFRMHFLRKR
jgi:transcriptional regulator GlxA family with amidase domain